MKNLLTEHEESIKSLTVINKQQDHLIQISKFSLVKYLKELEDIKCVYANDISESAN